MATRTTNYNLKKPAATDFYSVDDANENMDALDAALHAHAVDTANPHAVTKAAVGLGNVDNTTDMNKPVSTAQAAALAAHASRVDNPHSVTAVQIGLDKVPNVATNDQTPTFSVAGTLATLVSGEKISVIFGKVMKAITAFIVHLVDYTLQVPYAGTTGGSVNAYTIATPTIAALVAGQAVCLKIHIDSTAASTLNWCALGAKSILKANGAAVTNLKAGGVYTMRYDGVGFILQGEGAGGNAVASNLLSGKTASTDAGDITGTMPEIGSPTITPSAAGDTAITAGHYSGGIVKKAYPVGTAVPFATPSLKGIQYNAYVLGEDSQYIFLKYSSYFFTYNKQTKVLSGGTLSVFWNQQGGKKAVVGDSNGACYVIEATPTLKKVNCSTGAVIWTTSSNVASGIFQMFVINNVLFVGTYTGTATFKKYDCTAGTYLGTYTATTANSPVDIKKIGNVLYVWTSFDKKVYTFNAETGAQISAVTYTTISPFVIDYVNNIMYTITTTSISAYTLTSTPVLLWTYSNPPTNFLVDHVNGFIAMPDGLFCPAQYPNTNAIKLTLTGAVSYIAWMNGAFSYNGSDFLYDWEYNDLFACIVIYVNSSQVSCAYKVETSVLAP